MRLHINIKVLHMKRKTSVDYVGEIIARYGIK